MATAMRVRGTTPLGVSAGRWLGLVLGLSLAGGCVGDDLAGPGRVPASLTKVMGDSQQVTVGTVAALPLVVEVTNAQGSPVSGVLVNFTVDSAGGSVAPNAVTTGPDGRAATRWQAPTVVGSYAVRTSAAGLDSTVFSGDVVAGGVATIELVSGDSQVALVGMGLDSMLVVRLKDAFGNLASGRPVTSAVIAGGGSVQPDTALADQAGLATFRWTMGPSKGFDTVAIRYNSVERRLGAIALPLLVPDSLALGTTHTCVLDAAGQAYCFGLNYYGEVGNGDTTSAFVPTPVNGAPAFRSITAGYYHSCGLTASSELYCWGTTLTRLGLGATRQDFGLTFEQVTAGVLSTCGVTAAGAGYCWGSNWMGQLGDGSTTDHPLPTPVSGNLRWRQIAAQSGHVCGLTTGGRAYCWGGGVTVPTPVAATTVFSTIATSANGACGLTVVGAAWCWDLFSPAVGFLGTGWSSLSGGNSGYCGVRAGGQGACWGLNAYGEVGDGTRVTRTSPTTVVGGQTFSTVGQGSAHSCGRTPTGGLYCWGGTISIVLGIGEVGRRLAPTAVVGGLQFLALAAGGSFTCGLATDSTAHCWGFNEYGQLGIGTTLNFLDQPTPVSGGHTWIELAAGSITTCGVAADGLGWCWGDNTVSPTSAPGGLTFVALDPGANHICGLIAGGALYCWGNNFYGQLGDSSFSDRGTPTLVAGSHTWGSASTGWAQTCGVDTSAAGYCWGSQLGLGTGGVDFNAPGSVSGGHTFISIASSTWVDAACGITSQLEAWCWGAMTGTNVPVLIPGGHQFTAVALGVAHACGLNVQGQVLCWGENYFGQLGDGTILNRPIPAPVSGNLTFTSLSAGDYQTCALTASGSAYCWGGNEFGGLGIGAAAQMRTPAQVW